MDLLKQERHVVSGAYPNDPETRAQPLHHIQGVDPDGACGTQHYDPPRFHMFYGFVAFITVGLLYSYRYVWRSRGWMELAYGLGVLFIMGLGIRAVLQVVK